MPQPNPILPELPGRRSPLPSLPALPGQERRPSRRRRRQPPETISDEERRSLLGRTLGGLAYVGGAIDKPFAAARGTVAALGSAIQGKPRQAKEDLKQLMHLIPFSGTFQEQLGEMGVDVPEEHIWGREVLERFGAPKNKPTGMAGWKNDPAEGFWDVAGIAADLLIAPPVMPGLLPVTAKGAAQASRGSKLIKEIDQLALAGKTEQALELARKFDRAKRPLDLGVGKAGLEQLQGLPGRTLGKTPAAKIAEVEAGERALLGLRPTWGPWSALLGDAPLATFGTGKKAAAALDAVYYRGGLIPTLRSAFGATTKGARTGKAQRAIEQEVALEVHRVGGSRGLLPFFHAEYGALSKSYDEVAQYAQVAGDKVGETEFRAFARYVGEKLSDVDGATRITEQEISALFHSPAGNFEALTKINEFSRRMHKLTVDTMLDIQDEAYAKYLKYGGQGTTLREAFAAHQPRVAGGGTDKYEGWMSAADRADFTIRRAEAFDIPGASWTINHLVSEGTWSKPADAALTKLIRGKQSLGGFKQRQVVQLKSTAGLKDTFEGFGRIVAFEGDNAVVSRMTSNGFMDQIRVPISALDDATQISGSGLVPPSLYTAAEQKVAWQTILTDAGIPVTGKESIKDLRAQAMYHGRLKPAFDAETTGGRLKLPRDAQGKLDPTKTPRWMDPNATDEANMARALQRLQTGIDPIYGSHPTTGKQVQLAEGTEQSISHQVAEWLGGGPALPDGLFNRTTVEDSATYLGFLAERTHGLMVKHNFLRGVVSTKQEAGYVPLSDAWGSVTTRFGRQAKTPRALSDDGLEQFMKDYNAAKGTQLGTGDLFVPEGTPKALQAFQDLGEPGSKVHSAFGQAFDAWTAAVKAGWTLPWPAFHVRNRTAGLFANISADVPWGIGHYLQSERSVGRWVLGKSNDFQFASEIGPSGILKNTRVLDIGKEAAEGAGDVAGGGLRWIFGAPKTWDPTKFRGAREAFGMKPLARGEAQFAPVAVGERAYSYVETMNRVSLYDAARRHGYSMQQATELVKRVQYDYSAVAPFEQDVMRRFVFPFYGWLKNNAIYHTGEIFGNPGGKVSTAIRMSATSNRFGAELPRWLSEQGAVPLGGPPEATSVIRQFGFPFEDVRNIQSTPGRTAQRGIAMMHPGISIPMKLFSGKDPYTGRDLKQMSGMTGIWQIDTLLQGLPTSRAYSTYRTATDKRKSAAAIGVDLLTGVKIGTYDMERSRLNDLERAIREEMDVNPYVWEGRHQYIPKHLKAQAGPEAPRKLRQVRALSKEREALKAKRELQAFGGVQETR